jgi:hypothetical protein
MTDVSAEEMVERARESLRKLLRWAEAYQPRTLRERGAYDEDLDEAEDLLEAFDAWAVLNADQWLRPVRPKAQSGSRD